MTKYKMIEMLSLSLIPPFLSRWFAVFLSPSSLPPSLFSVCFEVALGLSICVLRARSKQYERCATRSATRETSYIASLTLCVLCSLFTVHTRDVTFSVQIHVHIRGKPSRFISGLLYHFISWMHRFLKSLLLSLFWLSLSFTFRRVRRANVTRSIRAQDFSINLQSQTDRRKFLKILPNAVCSSIKVSIFTENEMNFWWFCLPQYWSPSQATVFVCHDFATVHRWSMANKFAVLPVSRQIDHVASTATAVHTYLQWNLWNFGIIWRHHSGGWWLQWTSVTLWTNAKSSVRMFRRSWRIRWTHAKSPHSRGRMVCAITLFQYICAMRKIRLKMCEYSKLRTRHHYIRSSFPSLTFHNRIIDSLSWLWVDVRMFVPRRVFLMRQTEHRYRMTSE